ncbi:MAG: SDR family NAD(P)-dependent oxidoreductase, partial [Alphaproteobacteria bacterium]|nr:SDR family NAD(P)-dependent oxidoreductase [Alphaproteobacteria bacterium]
MPDPLFDFTGKTVLVTGGSRGLGREMALGFARRGADAVIVSRREESCRAVAAEVEALGRRAWAMPCNVSDWDALEDLAKRAWSEAGGIDVLVNNAGSSPLAPSSLETPEGLFDKVLALNFKGPFRLTALLGAAMAAGSGGAVVNISSTGAIRPRPELAPYAGAKAA